MSQWLASVIDRAERVDDWLSAARQKALASLREQQWPTRRTEAWRYTSLHALENLQLENASNTPMTDVQAPHVEGLDAIDLLFVNGDFVASNTSDLPEGLQVIMLNEASASEQAHAAALFNQVKPEAHLFGRINDVLAKQGVIVRVAAGVKLNQPIRVVNMSSAGVESHHRLLVELEANAEATIIEHGAGSEHSLTTAFAEYALGKSAKLEHYRFAMHGGDALFFGGSHFNLGEHSTLNSTVVGYGSQISRLDIDLKHVAEHAFAKMNAIYLLAPKEHFDLHTNIEHIMPNGTTEENARGIVGDKARAVFNGRIHIHRDAQKTLAELNNRNLLLSRGATIATKPELEIYADDVQCAHGATVAEIAEKELYYLLSRGIPRSQALVMLNFGFIQELVNEMPNKALSAWLTPILRERFTAMEQA